MKTKLLSKILALIMLVLLSSCAILKPVKPVNHGDLHKYHTQLQKYYQNLQKKAK